MTPAEILFLWHERVKDDRIKVWMDLDGVLHFKTEQHPGVSFKPIIQSDETMGFHL